MSIREQQVLRLLAQGLTAEKVAEILYISKTTVVRHRRNIKRKLNAKNLANAVYIASQCNFI